MYSCFKFYYNIPNVYFKTIFPGVNFAAIDANVTVLRAS